MTKRSSILADPATQYAYDVLAGDIVAGPHVRDACRRHLNDLDQGAARGLEWDVAEVSRVIGFFRDVLTVEVEYTDEDGETVNEAVPFIVQPSQAFILGSLFGWKKNGLRRFRRAYIEQGKGPLALDTPIATPSGWTTMGEIDVGDTVFDSHGKPTKVVDVSEVFYDRECYRLTFSDGGQIVADASHEWYTAAIRNGRIPGKKCEPWEAPKGGYCRRNTKSISETLKIKDSGSRHPQAKWNHRIDVAPFLELPDIDLPVAPYTLGAWLGDGDSDCARITCADDEIIEHIVNDGYLLGKRLQKKGSKAFRQTIGTEDPGMCSRGHAREPGKRCLACERMTDYARRHGLPMPERTAISLTETLAREGLLQNKHIPAEYFRAGISQRLALLQGLMDTDGSVSPGGKCEMSLCNEQLAGDVADLLRTLGFKCAVKESAAKMNGKEVGRRWRIGFQAYRAMNPFRLTRKAERVSERPKTRPLSEGRMIVGCDPVDSVPVRCITVASEDHMFLAGRELIPTCNSGKSPMAAGIGHYMLLGTKKLRAEVYSAATDKDQAAILFRDAIEMWRRSPQLYKRLVPSGQNPVWQLTDMAKASFFKPISSEKKGKSGIRPYCALIDEVHEHPDNSVIEMLRAGTKGNRQALIFEITNSGYDRTSVCWNEHEYAIKVAAGDVDDVGAADSFFSYVCALDDGDDPFSDEACWIKANPCLGVTIQPDFIREQVAEAKGMPSKEGIVRRLHFCEWTGADTTWVGAARWLGVESEELKWEDYQGERCYGGLDMSYTTDMSACAWVFPTGADSWDAFVDFWLPKIGLHDKIKRDRVPYDLWAKNGYLRLTEGEVIKLAPIAKRMAEVADHVRLEGIAYDRYRHKELSGNMSDLGIELPMIEHPQGFRRVGKINAEGSLQAPMDETGKPAENPLWMPASVQELENAIIEQRIRVAMNPVLRWNASSTVIRMDPAGTDNKIFDKSKSLSRIDGIVALAMAVGIAKSMATGFGESVYETRGVIAF